MKKSCFFFISLLSSAVASAQVIPNFDLGVKAGTNLTKFASQQSLESSNRAGYLIGIWARAGALGLHIQPELYYTVKKTDVKDEQGNTKTVDFPRVDIPILLGTKIGLGGIGGRLNTGPVISFATGNEKSYSTEVLRFDYNDRATAWQFGAGLDIKKITLDLRYEHGLTKISRTGYDDTKLRLFNFSLGYKLF
ncbi:MAG TPA: porin family protein [Pedobacter sp.]